MNKIVIIILGGKFYGFYRFGKRSETTGIYGFVTGLLLIFFAPGQFMKFLG